VHSIGHALRLNNNVRRRYQHHKTEAMNTSAEKPDSTRTRLRRLAFSVFARTWTHLLLALLILLLDLVTGPYLLFPILFVIPVTLAAWFHSPRLAYALAFLLPLGRFFIAEFVDQPAPLPFIIANNLIRFAVLLFMAFLVSRTARQTKELEQRVKDLVTVCAWSRTVEYQGEWISFEEYLLRRFNINTSHGISPAEAKKLFGELTSNDRKG
jgi:K+-sensing histidine kinase KdpD